MLYISVTRSSTFDIQIAKEHGLSEEKYSKILEILGRDPNYVELGIFSVMWSEHCSYKSSKKFNAIFPYASFGVNLNPYQIKKPIAVNIGISMGVTPMYFPTSYESDADGVITLRDWKFTIMPLMGFSFLFPK